MLCVCKSLCAYTHLCRSRSLALLVCLLACKVQLQLEQVILLTQFVVLELTICRVGPVSSHTSHIQYPCMWASCGYVDAHSVLKSGARALLCRSVDPSCIYRTRTGILASTAFALQAARISLGHMQIRIHTYLYSPAILNSVLSSSRDSTALRMRFHRLASDAPAPRTSSSVLARSHAACA